MEWCVKLSLNFIFHKIGSVFDLLLFFVRARKVNKERVESMTQRRVKLLIF